MGDLGGAADRHRLHPGDPRAARVRGGHAVRGQHPATQPARALPGVDRLLVRRRHVQDDVAGLVQAAGLVAVHLAGAPAGAVPRLPGQRAGCAGRCRCRRRGSRCAAAPRTTGRPPTARSASSRPPPGRPRTPARRRPSASSRVWSVIAPSAVTAAKLLNSQGTIGRSATVVKTTGSSTSVRGVATSVSARTRTVAGCGGGQPERRRAARGGRRVELQADQLEELDVVPVRDAVQPVDQLVHHLRERLDQRDARVADVVVGPVGRALLDQALGVVDERLEVAVVEVGGGQDHVSSRPSALPTRTGSARAAESRRRGRPGCAGRSCRGCGR